MIIDWYSAVSKVICYRLDDRLSIPGKNMYSLFTAASRPDWGPIQSPNRSIPGGRVLSLVIKRPVREADHMHLMPRLRIREALPPLPHASSWRGS